MQPPARNSFQKTALPFQAVANVSAIEYQLTNGSVLDALKASLDVLKQDNALSFSLAMSITAERKNNFLYSDQVFRFFSRQAEWEPNNPVSFYILGQLYEQGKFVPKDLTVAIKHLITAIDLGYAEAAFHLATIYERLVALAHKEPGMVNLEFCRKAVNKYREIGFEINSRKK